MAKVKYITTDRSVIHAPKNRSRKQKNLSPYEPRNNNIGDMLFMPSSVPVKVGYKPYENT